MLYILDLIFSHKNILIEIKYCSWGLKKDGVNVGEQWIRWMVIEKDGFGDGRREAMG